MGDRRLVWGVWGAVCVALGVAACFPINNPDTFGHLAQGRQIVELGHVPRVDHFSIWKASPQPWVNYEWLADLITYGVHALSGFGGLVAFKILLLWAMAWWLLARAHRAGPAALVWAGLLIVWGLAASRYRLSMRPHLFGYVAAAFFLYALPLLTRADCSPTAVRRWTAALAGTHLLWVNLHGSNLLGLAFTGAYGLAFIRQPPVLRRLAVLGGLQLAVSCVSPFGPAIILDAVAHTFDPRYRALVSEWVAFRPGTDALVLGLGLGLACLLGVLSVRAQLDRGAQGTASLLVLAILAALAFRSVRFIALLLLLSAPIVAEGLSARTAGWTAARRRGLAIAAVVTALAVVPLGAVSAMPFSSFGFGEDTQRRPAACAQWLNRHLPRARVLSDMQDGWYLMYAAAAAHGLIDGRIPMYGPDFVRAVQDGFSDPGKLSALLGRHRIEAVVLRPAYAAHRPAVMALQASEAWALASLDERHALYVRASLPGLPPPLRALSPSYDPRVIWAQHARGADIRGDLKRLPRHENVRAYRQWVEALLSLSPLLRERGQAGLRAPKGAAERARVAIAARRLAGLQSRIEEDIPSLIAWNAAASIAACDLDAGRAWLARGGATLGRVGLLLHHELSLRQGRVQQVRAFVDAAAMRPGARDDAWVGALGACLDAPPRCDG